AYRERSGALRTNFDWNLVSRTTDATAADLDARLHIVERVMEDTQRLDLHASFNIVERTVDDAFGDRLLTVEHDGVHELGEDDIPELRIGKNLALLWTTTTSHWTIPFLSSALSGTCVRPGLTLAWLFGTLGAVLRTALLAVLDALRV